MIAHSRAVGNVDGQLQLTTLAGVEAEFAVHLLDPLHVDAEPDGHRFLEFVSERDAEGGPPRDTGQTPR
ncbi:hypothetical protein [Halolamina sp.]|uniref:hypothetical protein n=1 Tax=Halolamina sp. TaxID=1940283 RepID=UPI000677D29B